MHFNGICFFVLPCLLGMMMQFNFIRTQRCDCRQMQRVMALQAMRTDKKIAAFTQRLNELTALLSKNSTAIINEVLRITRVSISDIETTINQQLLHAKEDLTFRLVNINKKVNNVMSIKGQKGEKGNTGRSGKTGTRGQKGAAGISIQGPPGLIGPDGRKGDLGEKGQKGLQGDIGNAGLPGRDGLDGLNGIPGVAVKGDKGGRGFPGFKGQKGAKGAETTGSLFGTNNRLIKGEREIVYGPPGVKGIKGEPGLPGIPGLPGVPGTKGDKGQEGKTTYGFLNVTNYALTNERGTGRIADSSRRNSPTKGPGFSRKSLPNKDCKPSVLYQCPPNRLIQTKVRLIGPRAMGHQGRVEVMYTKRWGTICTKKWTDLMQSLKNAKVLCRMLGFNGIVGIKTGEAAAKKMLYSMRTNEPIWLHDLRCTGAENDVLKCLNDGIRNHNECSHYNDLWLECRE